MIARIGVRRLVLAAAALALAVWVLGFATRGLLSGDSGVKLAQAHALWESGFTTRALPYDHALDHGERFFPYGDFVIRVHGHRQGIYSLSFTALAAPLVGVLGATGTLLLGLAGGVLILVGVDLLAGRLGASPPARAAAAVVTVALTPVLLYTAQFAEHTPAVGLTILALAFVVGEDRTRPLLAGALVALAATFRAECYIACASVGLALAARPGPLAPRVRDAAFYLAGALAVLAAYWALNLALSHTWDPVVTFQKPAPDRWLNVKRLLIGEIKGPPPAGWLVLLIAAPLAALTPPTRADVALRVLVGVALCWLAWQIRAHATGRTLIGMFSLTPLAAYGLVASPWQPRWRPVWLFALVTTVAIVALNKSNDAGGLQLGARLLLPALPALVALAAAVVDDDVRRRRWFALAAPAALLVLSIAMFVRAWPAAYEIARKSELASRAVAASPAPVVVTRVWWESQVVTLALLDGKQILLAGKDLRPVLQALAQRGITRVLVVNKGPVDLQLPDGSHAHDAAPPITAWLELHDVAIDVSPRPSPWRPPAPAAP